MKVQIIGAALLSVLLAAPAVYAQGRDDGRSSDARSQRDERSGGDRGNGGRQDRGSRGASGSDRSPGAESRSSGDSRGYRSRGGDSGGGRSPSARGGSDRTGARSGSGVERDRGAGRGTYDRSGSDRGSYERGGSDRGTYGRSGADRGTYDRNGSDRATGRDRGSYTPDRGYGDSNGSRYRGNDRSSERDRQYSRGDTGRDSRSDRTGDRSGSYRAGSRDEGFRRDRSGSYGGYDRYRGGGSQASGRYGRSSWGQYRARDFAVEHRSWRDRGGYHGYRIPQSYFVSHFGRGHYFRGSDLQFVFIDSEPCFDYGRYRFTCLEPYPEYWGDDWYESDDCYVDYVDDGYYLCNRRFPGRPGIAVSINLRF